MDTLQESVTKLLSAFKELQCETCEVIFLQKRKDRPNQRFCSIPCSVKNLHKKEIIEKRAKTITGIKHTEEHNRKIALANTGKRHSKTTKEKLSSILKGRFISVETRKKMSISRTGKKIKSAIWTEERREKAKINAKRGPDSPVWVFGNYKKQDTRNDSAYINWVKQVKNRDEWKCKIGNECEGRIEIHHILSWREYPNLRYEINNGITLCHKHHPRRHEDEKRLSPYFTKLITKTCE